MRYRVHVSRLPGGEFQATCLDPQCSGRGAHVEEALEKLRSEITYRLEWCPCTSLHEGETVELDVVSRPPA